MSIKVKMINFYYLFKIVGEADHENWMKRHRCVRLNGRM